MEMGGSVLSRGGSGISASVTGSIIGFPGRKRALSKELRLEVQQIGYIHEHVVYKPRAHSS